MGVYIIETLRNPAALAGEYQILNAPKDIQEAYNRGDILYIKASLSDSLSAIRLYGDIMLPLTNSKITYGPLVYNESTAALDSPRAGGVTLKFGSIVTVDETDAYYIYTSIALANDAVYANYWISSIVFSYITLHESVPQE